MTIRTLGLRHIQIKVRDVVRAAEFYSKLLGVEEQFRAGDHTIFAGIPGGGDMLTLHQPDAAEAIRVEAGGLVHFGFAIPAGTNMDDAARQVAAAGGRVLRHGEHEPGKPFLYFHDLDGYEVELWTP